MQNFIIHQKGFLAPHDFLVVPVLFLMMGLLLEKLQGKLKDQGNGFWQAGKD